jgi:hypothetical protein
VTVLVASLVLAGGRAPGATINHFEGQFSSGPIGPNIGISTAEPGTYVEGTGQKIFYLSFGAVSSTEVPSLQWILQPLNNLTVDISAFTANNPFGSVTAFDMGDSTLLLVGQSMETKPHADFTMADTAKITTNGVDHATIEIGVTLRSTSDPNGDILDAFMTAGGGTFAIDIDNIKITQPTTDGQVFFPVDQQKQVSVNWSINPVPEPSTAVSMLIGAGLLALWGRRRRSTNDKVTG